jgi:hypothetical protein
MSGQGKPQALPRIPLLTYKNIKEIKMRAPVALCAAVLCLCVVPAISAQDAAKVDAKHYTVVSENDQVRILRAHTDRTKSR